MTLVSGHFKNDPKFKMTSLVEEACLPTYLYVVYWNQHFEIDLFSICSTVKAAHVVRSWSFYQVYKFPSQFMSTYVFIAYFWAFQIEWKATVFSCKKLFQNVS